jgi:hypothetical protein
MGGAKFSPKVHSMQLYLPNWIAKHIAEAREVVILTTEFLTITCEKDIISM